MGPTQRGYLKSENHEGHRATLRAIFGDQPGELYGHVPSRPLGWTHARQRKLLYQNLALYAPSALAASAPASRVEPAGLRAV